jgi:hypothetical protein
MSTDYRALCAELADALNGHTSLYEGHESELVARARTALAQPEPSWPPMPVPGDAEGLAEVFWGRYAQPEPEAGELVEDLRECADSCTLAEKHGWARVMRRAAELLTRYARPTIEPVPVSERLPGPEDCDAEGRCWWFNPGVKASSNPHIALSSWRLTHMLASKPMGTHWLPHHALPLPQQPS